LGLSVTGDQTTGEALLWANDLVTGTPIAGVTVGIASASTSQIHKIVNSFFFFGIVSFCNYSSFRFVTIRRFVL